ncbi:TetR family transcriptional regulator C-terminal domain-containing protein [Amycolatopsis thermalba]|uniref:TetR family transcriptional regulator C-terminal domain-containing protein n=1 Tax=Amycolatopsis thermalba TaxID=944492 RepID=A0ABY4NS65_9PSEU|nr:MULTISPECIES: TetR family transcriptional regulator C-terminal domain-containing protein [Amycolatopsis]OXM68979.1 TetR family transcriptional regulator [Amycolatopsis sp. KNN50.9b]UQS22900.1 TetR family transcriptional regulator C-terminal domain-containing protein [Amycolatopsis thermalba]
MPRPNVEAERREQILQAACHVIAEQGFRALRLADVAKVAGLSSGILHYYFTNKRDLVRAAFEQNVARSFARRTAILESDTDAVSKLRALVDAYLPADDETVESWHVWAELWVEAIHDPDLQDLNERAYGEWRRLIAGIVRDGQAAGQIGDADAVELANLLVAVLDGLALQVLAGSRNMTLARMRTTCQSFIDRVILPR